MTNKPASHKPAFGEDESPLKFPTAFPIKILGKTQDGFAQAVVEVVLRHAPETVTYHLRLDERTTAVDSLCYVASLAVSIKTVPNSP